MPGKYDAISRVHRVMDSIESAMTDLSYAIEASEHLLDTYQKEGYHPHVYTTLKDDIKKAVAALNHLDSAYDLISGNLRGWAGKR